MNLLFPLVAGVAFLALKGNPAPRIALVATGPQLIPSAPGSVIQAAPGAIPAVKGPGASLSPIEQAGYIPPVPGSTPGPSAVSLGRLRGCGCGGRCGGGLSGVPAGRQALRGRLEAIKGVYQPMLRQAIAERDRASIAQAGASMGAALRGAVADYHAGNPGDRVTALARSVAPVFLGPSRMGV